MKDGIPVSIVIAPNVGKSTLLNSILNEDKAITSPIAGTTRDIIEDTFNIKGKLFRFIDTAGIQQTTKLKKLELQGLWKVLINLKLYFI